MKFTLENLRENPVNYLRRAGYSFQHHVSNEMSFVRPLSRAGYPRFHMYITMRGITMHASIHIDHKKETYGNETRHHGEYDTNGALGPEIERIKSFTSSVGTPDFDFEP